MPPMTGLNGAAGRKLAVVLPTRRRIGRHLPGMVGDIISEWWAELSREGVGGIIPGIMGGLLRIRRSWNTSPSG